MYKRQSYILCLDANNLYGWAMSQPMPTGKIRWIEQAEYPKIEQFADNADTGYILDLDLLYTAPHSLHNDYPLAPDASKSKYSS